MPEAWAVMTANCEKPAAMIAAMCPQIRRLALAKEDEQRHAAAGPRRLARDSLPLRRRRPLTEPDENRREPDRVDRDKERDERLEKFCREIGHGGKMPTRRPKSNAKPRSPRLEGRAPSRPRQLTLVGRAELRRSRRNVRLSPLFHPGSRGNFAVPPP